MILSAIGTGLLVAIGFWIFGGFALRFGGALLVLAGAAGLAITGDSNGLLLVALGAAIWCAGHLHYALRHGAAKGPLAQLLFEAVAGACRRFCPCLQNGPSPDAPEPDGAGGRRGCERRMG